jgi:uncharacterized protein (DUF433 family)
MPKRIVRTADTCSGAPRLEGTRLTCENVVTLVEQLGLRGMLEVHGNLTKEDVVVALDYCSNLKCRAENVENFCEGCVLDTREDLAPSAFVQPSELDGVDLTAPGHSFLGPESEYEESSPIEGWIHAQRVLAGLSGE